jgi:hypothetical protein
MTMAAPHGKINAKFLFSSRFFALVLDWREPEEEMMSFQDSPPMMIPSPPRRKLDTALSLGFARTLTRTVQKREALLKETLSTVHWPAGSLITRKTGLQKIRGKMGQNIHGLVADQKVTRCKIVRSGIVRSIENDRLKRIGIVETTCMLARNGDRFSMWDDLLVYASEHFIQRYAQRTGCLSEQEVIDIMLRAAAWSRVAELSGDPGHWMLPFEHGLCCLMMDFSNGGAFGYPRHMSILITTYSHEEMYAKSHQVWADLVAAGGLSLTPRLPGFSEPTEAQMAAWRMMRSAGQAWEKRRAHARKTRISVEDEHYE